MISLIERTRKITYFLVSISYQCENLPGPVSHVQHLDTSHGLIDDGPNLSPIKKGSRVTTVPALIFQPMPKPGETA
jgi:hypothetical protein